MEGIPTLLSGDFRQILLVIHQGKRTDIGHAYINSSAIWPRIHPRQLQTNIRSQLIKAQNGDKLANLLLRNRNGEIPFDQLLYTIVTQANNFANEIVVRFRRTIRALMGWFPSIPSNFNRPMAASLLVALYRSKGRPRSANKVFYFFHDVVFTNSINRRKLTPWEKRSSPISAMIAYVIAGSIGFEWVAVLKIGLTRERGVDDSQNRVLYIHFSHSSTNFLFQMYRNVQFVVVLDLRPNPKIIFVGRFS